MRVRLIITVGSETFTGFFPPWLWSFRGAMNSKIKKILVSLNYHLGHRLWEQPGNRILIYHAFGSRLAHDTYGISIDPRRFEEHIRFSKENYLTVPVAVEIYQHRGVELNTVSISIDDGYADTMIAAEILTRHSLPFTVFITTGNIDQAMYLSKNNIRELAGNELCQLGTHGVSHRSFAGMSVEEQSRALAESKQALEDISYCRISCMSYPHGGHTATTKQLVKAAGYDFAASSIAGKNRRSANIYALRRIEIVREDTVRILKKKLSGFYDILAIRDRFTAGRV